MSSKRKILFYVVMVVLSLLILEAGLQAVAFFSQSRGWREAPKFPPSISRSIEFAKEADNLQRNTYIPFVGLHGRGYDGNYIHMSPDGVRATWNPPFAHSAKVKNVFCFGGSTLWGWGARDHFTIPSWLSRKLNQNVFAPTAGAAWPALRPAVPAGLGGKNTVRPADGAKTLLHTWPSVQSCSALGDGYGIETRQCAYVCDRPSGQRC